jgi:hypothetical protein
MIGLCVEWSKAKARAARWSEEVTLLAEEMRRVLQFLVWRKNWWLDQGQQREDARSDIKEGLMAYAAKQAAILQQMAYQFAEEWYPLVVEYGLDVEWPEEYKVGKQRVSKGKEKEIPVLGERWMEMDDDMFD